jgi:plasmid stabilization system protein ParE
VGATGPCRCRAIGEYIERDSSIYANAVVEKIIAVTRQLAESPFSGRVVPEFRDDNLREHFVFQYRLIYQVRKERIITFMGDTH